MRIKDKADTSSASHWLQHVLLNRITVNSHNIKAIPAHIQPETESRIKVTPEASLSHTHTHTHTHTQKKWVRKQGKW